MDSKIMAVTVQAAGFSAVSTVLAHLIAMWQRQELSLLDPTTLLGFMAIALITTPPNYLFQRFLEDTFPSKTRTVDPKKDDDAIQVSERLSIPNTAAKFFLDQTISAPLNTISFIFWVGVLKGKSLSRIELDIHDKFWTSIIAAWRFWPMVSLLNLLVIPFEHRMLVGNSAGLLWGVLITLRNM